MILNIISLDQVKHCNELNWDLKTVQRFWSKINLPDDLNINDCWEWVGGKKKSGYGQIHINGTTIGSHRLMYECYNGPIKDGLFACHECDNKSCVNPFHITPGTLQHNMDDAVKRNRMATGEDHGMSKLTEIEVKDILDQLILGVTQYDLAELYNIDQTNISCIAQGKNWKSCYNALTDEQKIKIKTNAKYNSCTTRKLVPEQVIEIRNLHAQGNISQTELCEMFNISQGTMSHLINRKTWCDI